MEYAKRSGEGCCCCCCTSGRSVAWPELGKSRKKSIFNKMTVAVRRRQILFAIQRQLCLPGTSCCCGCCCCCWCCCGCLLVCWVTQHQHQHQDPEAKLPRQLGKHKQCEKANGYCRFLQYCCNCCSCCCCCCNCCCCWCILSLCLVACLGGLLLPSPALCIANGQLILSWACAQYNSNILNISRADDVDDEGNVMQDMHVLQIG